MRTGVAVNTVNRAAMGAEQGTVILTRTKNLPPLFLLAPGIRLGSGSTADYPEDSKTYELIKISTIFRFPSNFAHFLQNYE